MDTASSSDLAHVVEAEEKAPPPATDRTPRPETVRLRSDLDDVMARLHSKLDRINGANGQAIAGRLCARTTKMACEAFKLEEEQ